MSTVNDPLTQGINALTTYANSVTGESDTNLSDAVYSLAQGYGQGGVFEKIGSYTVSESWENDSLGNPLTICQTVLPNLIDTSAYNIYFLDFTNNNASKEDYKADCIVVSVKTESDITIVNNTRGFCFRDNLSTGRSYSQSVSMWASEGTVINIYKLSR